MAKKDQNQVKNEKSASSSGKSNPRKNDKKKQGKSGFFAKVKKFFRDLKAELKRIIWPSKDKMIHSTAVVLSVIVAAVLVIWAVDTIVNTVLTATGFYDPLNVGTTPATTQGTTELPEDDTDSTTEADSTTEGTVEVTDPDEEASEDE